jgi:hypothetical protein
VTTLLWILHIEATRGSQKIKFLQRSEVQGAIYDGSQKIRFPILLPPNNFA